MQTKYSVSFEKREELNALSKEVFGASSRWVKLVDKGELIQRTEEITELVPRDNDSGESDERKSQIPVFADQSKKSKIYDRKRLTVEEVEARMVDMKARMDAVQELIAKMRADSEAKKAAQEAAIAATSSAV